MIKAIRIPLGDPVMRSEEERERGLRLDVMYPEKYKKVVFSIFFIHYV